MTPPSSNQQLRELLAEWDGLKYANEVMRTDGIGFDVILTRRALVMERIIEAARAVVAVETSAPRVRVHQNCGTCQCQEPLDTEPGP